MSNGFYNYIAKNTINFFLTKKDSIRSGERYCLQLDTEEMVKGVSKALQEYAYHDRIAGIYQYDNVYSTFTIRLSTEMELVIAAKMDGMTDDFLTTLRNAKLTEKCYPILMITYSPNDSVTSGTSSLSARGMPFHAETLISHIRGDICNAQLPKSTELLLVDELNRKQSDQFSDHSSLYEYSDLLTVLDRGNILPEDYHLFGLLEDPESAAFVDPKKIGERLGQNHKIFDEIDRIVKHGNIVDELDKKFDKDLIEHLNHSKRNGTPWYVGQTLQTVLSSQDRIQKKLNNPLEISNESFTIYSDSEIEYTYPIDTLAFIKNEGDTKSKKRIKNVLIYNPDHRAEVTVSIDTNVAVRATWINCAGASIATKARNVTITMNSAGLSFSFTKITDPTNNITYTIKICIVDILPQYLESIQTSYLLSATKTLRHCAIQAVGLGKELVINPRQESRTEAVLKNQESYSCNFDQTLVLTVDEDSILPDSGDCTIVLKFGAISIPLEIKDESSRMMPLTGIDVLRQKYSETKRLEYRDGKLVAGTAAFYAQKGEFQKALELEGWILKHRALAVDLTIHGPVEHPLQVSDAVREAYVELLERIEDRRQLPSLVQYTDEVKEAAIAYVKAVREEFDAILSGDSLKTSQSGLLLIGCVMQTYDEYMIRMSPLHPINVQYQLMFLGQENIGGARDQILEKMTPLNLLPYIRDQDRNLYHAVEQKYAPEWRVYAQVSNRRYQSARNFVQKLVSSKISQYKDNFPFLFGDIDNHQICINLVNMGDCKEILEGLVHYYARKLGENVPTENLDRFAINIYGDRSSYNAFSALGDHKNLREFVLNCDYRVEDPSEMSLILASNIKCYFRSVNSNEYQYAHLTFYEMSSSSDHVTGRMENIPTGISLNGLTSGVPSVLDRCWYKTGFGMRFAAKSDLTAMASYYNSLYHVAFSGSSYDPNVCTFTEIEKGQEGLLKKIYQASNWVVFVSPKVDLSFFQKKSSDERELMIIHYSDQYTSSNGYDDITVTQKSAQYREIICEQLQKRNVAATAKDIDGVINMFNAVNGSWMLKLISAKKMTGAMDSYFSREKMSILSAIKLSMAYYAHNKIIWIPISLEEILRVSGVAGLSQGEGLLSGKNLGFPHGPTSDDILLVGIEGGSEAIRVYLHPIEVKTGQNFSGVYGKAKQQVLNTYEGFWNALWPDEGRNDLEHKVTRNFFMQLVLVCCEKMRLYGVCPTTPWEHVLEDCREALLNEGYVFSHALDPYIGKGTVVSFKADVLTPEKTEDDQVTLLEFPEKAGADYMVRPISEIAALLEGLPLTCGLKRYCGMKSAQPNQASPSTETVQSIMEDAATPGETPDLESMQEVAGESQQSKEGDSSEAPLVPSGPPESEPTPQAATTMEILFGIDVAVGQPLYWRPNDTEQIFHTNTGIIGTMGTGKTQFTKSMIAQLYREQSHNFRGESLGILIFDYKGDYNESKADFVQMTNARILKPYQLPFNPLAITKSKVFRPLLPVHTANAFKDTLSKVYGLGAKQQNALLTCIMEAYKSRGIMKDKSDTWEHTPPTFESVYRVYEGNDEIKKNDSLAAAMDKLHEFQVFAADPEKTISLFDLLKGVVVIDLSGYDSDIQSLIVAITLDLFYAQMQAAGSSRMDHQYRELTKLILVDEADNFMSEGFPALKKILKEGREFGVGTILSTQFLKHFGSGDDDYSKYILTWIVHNVADLKQSDVEFVFKTEAKSQETQELFNDIKGLQKHHSIIKIGNNLPRYVKDKAFWELYQEHGYLDG